MLFLWIVSTAGAVEVSDYRPFFARVNPREVALRQIVYPNGTTGYLVVNTSDFSTRVVRRLPRRAVEVASVDALSDTSAYFSVRKKIEADPDRYASGIGCFEGVARKGGVVVSGDLCPASRQSLERAFLDSLAAQKKSPTLYVCISGRWIDRHAEELEWLRRKKIDLVWVNHSLTHRYERKANPAEDFLCLPDTDLPREVLGMERKMFELGLMPSPFFRYPGLIASPEVAAYVLAQGLIPLGADAWLAKGGQPAPGRVVLVHLNGNEPQGIKLFFDKKIAYPILPIQ